jgi:CheY-like chemotaxis protein
MRKILLVEDENVLREAYTLILSSEPYDLYTATNGQEALELCQKYTFDLILLDLMMPVLNGVGFLEQFSADNARFAPTKVVLLSNLSSGKDLSRALKLGVRRNILKADISPRQLLAAVRYELEA